MKYASILLPVLLTASVAFGGNSAQAEPADGVRTESVSYGDLDLTSPSGIRTLDRRISQAITRVCDRGDVRDLTSMSEERRCRSSANYAANAQRNHALAAANAGSIQLASRR